MYRHVRVERMRMPEPGLWTAVIGQAVDDLFYNKRGSHGSVKPEFDARRIRQSAHSFLFSNAPMFQRHRKFVFECTGICPDIVMRDLRKRADDFETSL